VARSLLHLLEGGDRRQVQDYESNLLFFFNPCGESDKLIVHLNFAKIAERGEAKSAKQSFASKYFYFFASLSHF